MNELWQELPDREGLWWAIDPSLEHDWEMAEIRIRYGVVWAYFAGDDGRTKAKELNYLWQKAIPPIYHWPSPDYTP